MPIKINRDAYAKLIAEDIAWLYKQPRTLERDHIHIVLRWSVDALYPTRQHVDEGDPEPWRSMVLEAAGALDGEARAALERAARLVRTSQEARVALEAAGLSALSIDLVSYGGAANEGERR